MIKLIWVLVLADSYKYYTSFDILEKGENFSI